MGKGLPLVQVNGPAMNAFERLKKIEELTSNSNFVSIAKLAKAMKVSQSTVRRDLAYLEERDLITRVSGDIMWKDNLNEYLRLDSPQSKNVESEKESKMGRYAASLVKSGDSLYIDPSWTNLEMTKHLPMDIHLTVSTNDLRIALELEKRPNVTVFVLGGTLRHGFHCTTGDLSDIHHMRYSKYFTLPGAISHAGEIMYYHVPSISIREAAHRHSTRTYVFATHEKFGKTGFVTAFSLADITELITDQPVDGTAVRLPKNLKVSVIE